MIKKGNNKNQQIKATQNDSTLQSYDEKNLTYKELSKQITNLEQKIDNLMNEKVRTKEIINITKETIFKENKKSKIFPRAIIIIILLFVAISLADVLYYIYNKANQIKIINNKIQENILTQNQLQDFNDKITEISSLFENNSGNNEEMSEEFDSTESK